MQRILFLVGSGLLLTLLVAGVFVVIINPETQIVANLGQMQATAATIIQLDPNTTYQTFEGWEATGFNGNTDLPELGIYGFNPPVMDLYKDVLADMAVNDLGINRVRLELASGAENPTDVYAQYINGQVTKDVWKAVRQSPTNDNSDPTVIDSSHFQFSFLDHKVDTVALPLKQQLEAKGETLYINLNYVDFDSSPFEHKANPQEYAEFILAAFLHLDTKYGWTPDAVEVILEPNNGGWSPTQVGNALVAAAQRLGANGYHPDFIAPSHSAVGLSFFDQMVQNVPAVLNYLTEFSYHCYGNCQSDANLQGVATRGSQNQIQTSQLEHIGHTYKDLHRDLKLANVSSWAQFTLAAPYTNDSGADYFFVDLSDQANPTVSMRRRTKLLRQYMLFIKRGAVRIEATSTDTVFDPVAFINSDGKYVVVVKATSGGSIALEDLPAGTFGIKYTTNRNCDGVNILEYDVDLPDITLAAGEVLNTSIPDCGVITVYQKSSSSPEPVEPKTVTISGPASGKKNTQYSFSAQIQPSSSTLPISYTWSVDGAVTAVHSAGLTDTLPISWEDSGSHTIGVTASNSAGAVSDQHLFTVVPEQGLLQFAAPAYSISEDSTLAVITVERIGGVGQEVQVAYASSDGTATAGADYQPVSGTLTFPQSVLSQDISMAIIDDNLDEPDESIQLALSNPTTGTLLGALSETLLTVLDEDLPPVGGSPVPPTALAISGLTSAEELNVSDTFTAVVAPLTVTLPLTYVWSIDDSRVATHTTGLSDTLSLHRAGAGSHTIGVTASNSAGVASDTYTLNITPEPLHTGLFSFVDSSSNVVESAAEATVVVQRTQGTDGQTGVTYFSADGTAMADLDYSLVSGTLTFAQDVQSQTFQIPIVDDDLVEGNETLTLVLSNPTGGAALGSPHTVVLTILDNDDEDTPGTFLPNIEK